MTRDHMSAQLESLAQGSRGDAANIPRHDQEPRRSPMSKNPSRPVPCSIDGCEKPSRSRGWCVKHYRRWERHGDPTPPGLLVQASNGEPMAWITHAVGIHTDDCLIWPYGTDTNGYGCVRYEGKKRHAHRVALMLATGEDGEGLDAAHAPSTCHTPLCCNPRHLRWATRSENHADKVIDDTHNRGERNSKVKLTEAEVLVIRADTRTLKAIAAAYGVSDTHVSKIKRQLRWAWLGQESHKATAEESA